MRTTYVLKALGSIDAKSVRRDSLLRWMGLIPILIALLLRWGVPSLAVWLSRQFQFDLVPYYPLLMSFVLLAVPMMYGSVIGFLLLDQRDDHTLTALQVTPLTLNGYLAYRITIPMLLSVVMSVIIFPVAGLVEIRFLPLLIAALAASLLAPGYALLLAAFAKNKVQGFALMKAAGILGWPPVMAYFVQSGWQLAFGIVPTYWPAKLFWVLEAGEANAWVYLLVGVVYQSLLVAILLRRFNRVMLQ
ncbi:hypothetical protein IIA15_05805 [candidate division TA06 bacterium]|nr:hypothetical protein [candidate division TA06 bacterium]